MLNAADWKSLAVVVRQAVTTLLEFISILYINTTADKYILYNQDGYKQISFVRFNNALDIIIFVMTT